MAAIDKSKPKSAAKVLWSFVMVGFLLLAAIGVKTGLLMPAYALSLLAGAWLICWAGRRGYLDIGTKTLKQLAAIYSAWFIGFCGVFAGMAWVLRM